MKDPTFIDEQRNADLMDAMADYAFELEEAMRESDPTQIHWVCVGYDTHKMMNDALGYMINNIYPVSQQSSRIKNVQRYQPERLSWGE